MCYSSDCPFCSLLVVLHINTLLQPRSPPENPPSMGTVLRMPWAGTKMAPILEPSGFCFCLFCFFCCWWWLFCCCCSFVCFCKGAPSSISDFEKDPRKESLKSMASQCTRLVPISDRSPWNSKQSQSPQRENRTQPPPPCAQHSQAALLPPRHQPLGCSH